MYYETEDVKIDYDEKCFFKEHIKMTLLAIAFVFVAAVISISFVGFCM
jgi:hypothetical protein